MSYSQLGKLRSGRQAGIEPQLEPCTSGGPLPCILAAAPHPCSGVALALPAPWPRGCPAYRRSAAAPRAHCPGTRFARHAAYSGRCRDLHSREPPGSLERRRGLGWWSPWVPAAPSHPAAAGIPRRSGEPRRGGSRRLPCAGQLQTVPGNSAWVAMVLLQGRERPWGSSPQ